MSWFLLKGYPMTARGREIPGFGAEKQTKVPGAGHGTHTPVLHLT
jgi:hypothetical protein